MNEWFVEIIILSNLWKVAKVKITTVLSLKFKSSQYCLTHKSYLQPILLSVLLSCKLVAFIAIKSLKKYIIICNGYILYSTLKILI